MSQFINEDTVTTVIPKECTITEEKIKIAPLDAEMFKLYKEPVLIGKKHRALLRHVFASVGITFETLRQISEKRGRPLDELDFQELIDCDCVMNKFWRKNNNIELPNIECAICHGPVYPNEIAIIKDGEIIAGPKTETPGIGNFVVKMEKIHEKHEIRILSGCGLINCETSHMFQLRVKKFFKDGIPDRTTELLPTLTYMEAIKSAKSLAERFHIKFSLPQYSESTLQKKRSEKKIIRQKQTIELFTPIALSPEKAEAKKLWESKQKRRKK